MYAYLNLSIINHIQSTQGVGSNKSSKLFIYIKVISVTLYLKNQQKLQMIYHDNGWQASGNRKQGRVLSSLEIVCRYLQKAKKN